MPVAALLTRHGKGALLAPALQPLGFSVFSTDAWDTDRFGTFCGDVERPLPPAEMVRLKAILASDLSGCRYGLGSEGSFGGGPYPGILPWQQELVALYDRDTGQCITGVASGPAPLTRRTLHTAADLQNLLQQYPGQGWMLRKNEKILKGLSQEMDIMPHLTDWPAELEPDWRAMHSPLRGQRIREAAADLALRLTQCCPACQRPDFRPQQLEPGLPCAACGAPTHRILRRIARCPCGYQETTEVSGLADPFDCQYCNP